MLQSSLILAFAVPFLHSLAHQTHQLQDEDTRSDAVSESPAEGDLEKHIEAWATRATRHEALKRFSPYYVLRTDSPLILFVHERGGFKEKDLPSLGEQLVEAYQQVKASFDQTCRPILGASEPMDGHLAVWVTGNDDIFAQCLPIVGAPDVRSTLAWFSAVDRALFAKMTPARLMNEGSIREFRIACAHALIASTAVSGQANVRSFWMLEGLARYIAGCHENRSDEEGFFKEDMRLFTEKRAELGCAPSILLGIDGLTHPLAIREQLDYTETLFYHWRKAAVHGVVLFLMEGMDEAFRSDFLQVLRAEMRGRSIGSRLVEALGIEDPTALTEASEMYAHERLRSARSRVEVRMADRSPSSWRHLDTAQLVDYVPARTLCLCLLGSLRFREALDLADENELDGAWDLADRLQAWMDRFADKIRQSPQRLNLKRGQRKLKGQIVDIRGSTLILRSKKNPDVELDLATVGSARLVSLAKKSGLKEPRDHACYYLLALLRDDIKVARRELAQVPDLASDLTQITQDWKYARDDIDCWLAVEALLREDSDRLLESLPKTLSEHGKKPMFGLRRGELRKHLHRVLSNLIPADEDFVRIRFPQASYDIDTHEITLRYGFERESELEDFEIGRYEPLRALDQVRDRVSERAISPIVDNDRLEVDGGPAFLRHVLPLGAPLEISLSRKVVPREDEPDPDAPHVVVGLLDDGEGNYLASYMTVNLHNVERSVCEQWSLCADDYQEDWSVDKYVPQKLTYHTSRLEMFTGQKKTVMMDVALDRSGFVFLFVAGDAVTHVDNLVIRGVLNPSSLKEIRSRHIQRLVERHLRPSR